jgi:hypothetical protein
MPLEALSGTILGALRSSFIALHGANGAEVSGNGYRRRPAEWRDVDGGIVLAQAVEFDKMPRSNVTAIGFWTAASGGERLLMRETTAATNAGDTLIFDAGSIGLYALMVEG